MVVAPRVSPTSVKVRVRPAPNPLPRLRTLDRNDNSPKPQCSVLEGGVRGTNGGTEPRAKSRKLEYTVILDYISKKGAGSDYPR